jgi:transposase-like protein
MTHYQVTLDHQLLNQLFIGDSRDAAVAALLETVLNQVLKAQATDQLSASTYERTEERLGLRNGSYSRGLTTRVGSLTLQVPRFRDGKFSTELFQRYQRTEQALVLTLMELVVNGVSTRKVAKVTEELCGTEFSKSTVSELCKQLDPIVLAWNNRPLHEIAYPFLTVDAMYVKVREDGRVRSRGVFIGYGVSSLGNREILGLMIGDTESSESWGMFFKQLKDRGLHGVDCITSDTHGGIVKAVKQHFQGSTWQRCQSHFMKNILDATPKTMQAGVKGMIRAIFESPKPEIARKCLEDTLNAFQDKAPKAMEILENGFEDATAVLHYPEMYHVRLRTSNGIERVNGEIRRRESVIRIFPNRESVMRLIGSVLMEIETNWEASRTYMDMTAYHEWCKEKK